MKRLRESWGGLSRRERIAVVGVVLVVAVLSLPGTEHPVEFARSVWAWLGGAL